MCIIISASVVFFYFREHENSSNLTKSVIRLVRAPVSSFWCICKPNGNYPCSEVSQCHVIETVQSKTPRVVLVLICQGEFGTLNFEVFRHPSKDSGINQQLCVRGGEGIHFLTALSISFLEAFIFKSIVLVARDK